jgi:hypothetical protein
MRSSAAAYDRDDVVRSAVRYLFYLGRLACRPLRIRLMADMRAGEDGAGMAPCRRNK